MEINDVKMLAKYPNGDIEYFYVDEYSPIVNFNFNQLNKNYICFKNLALNFSKKALEEKPELEIHKKVVNMDNKTLI